MQLKNDNELTSDEARRLEKAFGDDEFCKLMAEYANELSDPKYKEEQEAYLALLETNNELPSGKILVWPSSGFVVKCMHRKRRETTGSSIGSSGCKLFLNMVYSEKVARPVEQQQQLEGTSWSVPYALGPVHMEHDKSGSSLVPTFDCCFHSLSLRQAHANKGFLNLLINIAKDAVINAFTTSGDEVDILDGYTILRGVSYKTGKPRALMMIMMPNKLAAEKDEDMSVTDQPTPQVVEKSSTVSSPLEMFTPKYKIVEQHAFDIVEQSMTTTTMSKKPSHLVVTVYLDTKTKSVNEIDLQVYERELIITPNDDDNNDQPSCRYKLNVILPYPVDKCMGNASFDTNSSLLVVTLPVVA